MRIPLDMLSPEALRGLIAEFVTRDGDTFDEAEKIAQVERQLNRGEVVILFDPESETTTLAEANSAAARSGLVE